MNESLYLVSGAGISVLCSKESVTHWIQDIIDRGGTPDVKLYREEPQ